MTVVFGAAVGLAAYRQSWADWHEALLVSAICWIVLGLASQIARLTAALRNTRDLVAAQRRGGRFAIAWRLAAMGLLVGCPAIEVLRREGALALQKPEAAMYDVGDMLRDVLFDLAIILSLSSVPRLAARTRPASVRRRVTEMAGWIAGSLLVAIAIADATSVAFSIHIAIRGIEGSFPVRFAVSGAEPDFAVRDQRFALASASAACILLLNLLLIRRLTLGIPNSRKKRLSIACLLAGLAACAGYDYWLYAAGLSQFSSWLPEATVEMPWHWKAAAIALLALASGAATYGLLKRPGEALDCGRLEWRPAHAVYSHERRATAFALSIALASPIVRSISQLSNFGGWRIGLGGWLAWSTSYAELAALLLALIAAFGGWSKSITAADFGQVPLPGRFGACWLAMFMTFALAGPIVCWFNFSLWATFVH